MAKQKVEWVKEQEAAEILGLKKETLRRYATYAVRKMNIGFTKLNKKTFYYNKVDIEQYMLEQSNL